jgi:repressor of nif and glnA expression
MLTACRPIVHRQPGSVPSWPPTKAYLARKEISVRWVISALRGNVHRVIRSIATMEIPALMRPVTRPRDAQVRIMLSHVMTVISAPLRTYAMRVSVLGDLFWIAVMKTSATALKAATQRWDVWLANH